MSDSEEENFCFFGKPLEPYDEDAFPKKKPIALEDQVAKDAQGRRRFHGAFTGGFSAGFFNTVGTLEGWTPSEFKSTRQDKAKEVSQKPEDFMDDEDIGEYGFAAQTVKATKDYSTAKKRHRQVFSDGPIPGDPVLHSLLTSGNETIGYLLLKNMGIKEKISNQEEEASTSDSKVYGCHIPKSYEISKDIEDKQYEIPDIYKNYFAKPKANTFGLGYEGLDRSHINLFQETNFVVRGKNNEKLTISGKAFGVGAFEEEDDDIYMKEDMTKYDFELTGEKKKSEEKGNKSNLIFDMFIKSKTPLINKKQYPPPKIPSSFTGKHKVRKSRFEPLPEESATVSRNEINPAIRAKYLGEETNENFTPSKPVVIKENKKEKIEKKEEPVVKKEVDFASSLMFDRFVSASKPEDPNDILAPVEQSETTHGTKEMRDAAKMKMFGPLTRITIDWYPCALLCKRFNVPEPLLDKSELQKNRKRTKNLIFEYQKHSESNESVLKPGISTPAIKEEIMEDVEENSSIPVEEVDNQNNVPEKEDNVEPAEEKVEEIMPIDITDKIDVEKNIDLFKAVFLSSSESEDSETEETKEKDTSRQEEIKMNVLTEELIPKIKPLKEGILSNVPKFIFTKPIRPAEETESTDKAEEKVSKDNKVEQDLYGPKLPEILPANKSTKICEISSDEDEWIEKDDKGREKKKKSKHKKEKKHKKDKHKKSKHKKDKYK